LDTRASAPLIIRFNPWVIDDIKPLIQEFLKLLKHEMAILRNKTGKLDQVTSVLDGFSTLANLSAPLLLPFNPVISASVMGLSAALQKTSKELKDLKKSPSLEEVKNDICKKLEALNFKVIVYIDDIDRLHPVQVRTVFQMIKAV
jgi:predicted KAP-like P-loop ATPase